MSKSDNHLPSHLDAIQFAPITIKVEITLTLTSNMQCVNEISIR